MKKRFKKLLILGIIFGILIAGIAAFFILNSTPDSFNDEEKEEAVAEILGRKPNLNPDIKTGNVEYKGTNLSFNYPAKAVIYEYEDPDEKNDSTTIDSFSFDIENPRLILNYTAVKKPELRSLEDVPAVKLRQDLSRGYTSDEFEIEGINGMSYMKKEGGGNRAEHTGFLLNNGVLYTISITGASLEDVDELFDEVINSAEFN